MGQFFSWFKGPPARLQSNDLEGVAQYIASGKCKNIVIMAGAGVSRSAGIPDFRSQVGGLYTVLREWDISVRRPEDIFTLSYFKENPKPFYKLMSQLYGGSYRPTLTHSFFRLLDRRRILNAVWSQNVDSLERVAGLPSRRLIEAHGTLDSQHCTTCKAKYDDRKMKQAVITGDVPVCEKKGCKGFVKPDVVMFGESRADLLIIVGTSLAVPPFSFIANWVPKSCPRVVINMESVWGVGGRENDVQILGDCDETVRRLARLIGQDWEDELDSLWKGTEGKFFQYKEGIPA